MTHFLDVLNERADRVEEAPKLCASSESGQVSLLGIPLDPNDTLGGILGTARDLVPLAVLRGLQCLRGVSIRLLERLRHGRPEASHTESLDIGGASIVVVFSAGDARARRRAVLAWVTRSAQAVTTYFGRFPVKQVHVLVSSSADGGIIYGAPRTYGVRLKVAIGK